MLFFNKLANQGRGYFQKGGAGDTLFRKIGHTASAIGSRIGSIAPHVQGVVGAFNPALATGVGVAANLASAASQAIGSAIHHGRRELHNALEKSSGTSQPAVQYH